MSILHKKSAVAGKVPAVGDLAPGQLALNTHDGKIFMKVNDGVDRILEVSRPTTVAVDPRTTGLGITYTSKDVYSSLAALQAAYPAPDNGTFYRLTTGENYTYTEYYDPRTFGSIGSSWRAMYSGAIDFNAGYGVALLNDLSLPFYQAGSQKESEVYGYSPDNASLTQYTLFVQIDAMTMDIPYNVQTKYRVTGNRLQEIHCAIMCPVTGHYVEAQRQSLGYAVIQSATVLIGYRDSVLYGMWKNEEGSNHILLEGPPSLIRAAIDYNSVDGGFGNEAQLNSIGYYSRYTMSESEYKWLPAVKEVTTPTSVVVSAFEQNTMRRSNNQIFISKCDMNSAQARYILDNSTPFEPGTMLKFVSTGAGYSLILLPIGHSFAILENIPEDTGFNTYGSCTLNTTTSTYYVILGDQYTTDSVTLQYSGVNSWSVYDDGAALSQQRGSISAENSQKLNVLLDTTYTISEVPSGQSNTTVAELQTQVNEMANRINTLLATLASKSVVTVG